MTERMAPGDVAFLHRETRVAPQHVGELAIFAPPPAGFDYDRLVRLLEERISLAPRFRQKVRMVPGHLAEPLWVDDPGFDITYHVRRSALPRPGNDAQLLEFCARIQSRRLDRSRPLWELYLVEGLSDGRVAIVTKTHEAMVGGADGVAVAQVILEAAPAPRRTVEALWLPASEPSDLELVRDAAAGIVRRPLRVLGTVRANVRDMRASAGRAAAVATGAASFAGGIASFAGGLAAAAGGVAGGMVSVGSALARSPAPSPLSAELGEQRRLAVARTSLADYRRVRDAHGGTVNDVVLAVIAGALRGWLLSRAVPLRAATSVRALVPVSVIGDDTGAARGRGEGSGREAGRGPGAQADGDLGRDVRPLLVDLPVGEPDPVLRLAQLRYAMAVHGGSGRAVDARTLATLSGYAPSTLHALGARAGVGLTRRMFSLAVTNAPGPQWPLYAAGVRLTEVFPVPPLNPGQAVSIAVSSYDGGVFYGINADRDAVADVATLGELVGESLAELLAVARSASRRVTAAPSE